MIMKALAQEEPDGPEAQGEVGGRGPERPCLLLVGYLPAPPHVP